MIIMRDSTAIISHHHKLPNTIVREFIQYNFKGFFRYHYNIILQFILHIFAYLPCDCNYINVKFRTTD